MTTRHMAINTQAYYRANF